MSVPASRSDLTGADTKELTIVPKTIKKRMMNKNNLTEMKRKDYTAPTTRVVVMRHRTHLLLQASGVQSTRNSYGTANDGVVDPIGLVIDGNWMWE